MATKSSAFSGAGRPSLCERALRANPAFELVLFDRLPAGERRLLAGMARDPEHYGVLRPRTGSGLGLKSVDRETALLFLTLGVPGPLPSYVRSQLGEEAAAAALARLVADGILEVEQEAGRFVSGAAAMALIAGSAAPAARLAAAGFPVSPGAPALAGLSRAALRYGQELARTLPEIEPLRLSLRLYGYHRRPLTPSWRRALPAAEETRRYLGVAPGDGRRGLLARHWVEQTFAAADSWLWWRPLASGAPLWRSDGATYKLYVSPAVEALPAIFGRILDGLAAAGAPSFKVGAAAGGLLRPDKLIAYFDTFEQLAEAAAGMSERLAGVEAHGVPFSSEIAGGGLLSWGVDPPAADAPALAWSGGESWRLWLTHRLARALIAAVAGEGGGAAGGRLAAGPPPDEPEAPRGASAASTRLERREPREPMEPMEPMEPWRFAVERLRLEGVDTDSWTPGGRLWRQRQGEAAP